MGTSFFAPVRDLLTCYEGSRCYVVAIAHISWRKDYDWLAGRKNEIGNAIFRALETFIPFPAEIIDWRTIYGGVYFGNDPRTDRRILCTSKNFLILKSVEARRVSINIGSVNFGYIN